MHLVSDMMYLGKLYCTEDSYNITVHQCALMAPVKGRNATGRLSLDCPSFICLSLSLPLILSLTFQPFSTRTHTHSVSKAFLYEMDRGHGCAV